MRELLLVVFFAGGCELLPRECEKIGIVKTIDRCDRWGRCGVTLDSGESAPAEYPVIGAKVSILVPCERK